MSMSWGRNDALFKAELYKGFQYQRFVADFLLARGIDVVMPRMRLRGSIRQAHHFTDEPDMVANGKVLEIKSRDLTFLRNFDLPTTVLLDTKAGHDAKQTKPYAFVIVSQHTGAMLWTKGHDPDRWAILRITDRKRNTTYDAYAARRLTFAPMPALVEELRSFATVAKEVPS